MREQFGKTIIELAERDSRIILITGDVEHCMDEFKKRFPERFFNVGLCEQSMISLAAGLASEGFRPVVYSITPFVIERPFEQVKLDIDQQNLPVILVGYSDYPTAGPTHTDLNCRTLTSLLKNTVCYFPKNSKETKEMLADAYKYGKPAFISLKKDKKTPPKILVTGGAGYVGSVLVPKILSKGYNVRVLDSMIFGENGLKEVKDKCEIIKGDITDLELVKKCLEGIDSVIHLAAISNDPCCDLDPKITEKVNFEATRDLVWAAKKQGVKRFIYASSGSVYGIQKEKRITEDWPLNPLTVYAKTKAMSEEVVKSANDKNFTTVILRPATTAGYSPRLRLDLIVNIFTEQAINRGWLSVDGGSQMRPSIDIRDITDYYIFMLDAPADKIGGEVFNASNDNYSVMEIAQAVKDVIGNNVEIIIKPVVDLRNYPMVSEKITRVLGLKPKHSVKESVLYLKEAFDKGFIPNPSDSIYRNIETMKKIGMK